MKEEITITNGINQVKDMLVLSGRDLGEKQRQKFSLDNIDKNTKLYKVIIPKNIVSINPSFFLGVFGNSVRYFKSKEKFLEKYEFDCNENAYFTIIDGINDALNNIDILR